MRDSPWRRPRLPLRCPWSPPRRLCGDLPADKVAQLVAGAYHFAGHGAVAAIIAGVRLRDVELFADGTGTAHAQILPSAGPHTAMLVADAGLSGEVLITDGKGDGANSHYRRTKACPLCWLEGADVDVGGAPVAVASAFLVTRLRPAVAAIARELFTRRRLSRAKIIALVLPHFGRLRRYLRPPVRPRVLHPYLRPFIRPSLLRLYGQAPR